MVLSRLLVTDTFCAFRLPIRIAPLLQLPNMVPNVHIILTYASESFVFRGFMSTAVEFRYLLLAPFQFTNPSDGSAGDLVYFLLTYQMGLPLDEQSSLRSGLKLPSCTYKLAERSHTLSLLSFRYNFLQRHTTSL